MTQRIRGVLSPVVTPFKADLSPDRERFIAHCKWLLSQNCGLAVFGTTSEANSLSVEERSTLLDALVAAGVDTSRMMPGTGCCSITETVKLTAQAVKHGCAGVLMLPPFYYKGVSEEGLYRYFSEVVQRVGDARLKIYLYHIPPVAQVGYSLDLVGRFIKTYPETVVGLKDSSGDWSNTAALLDRFPGFAVFPGSEVFLLDALRKGKPGYAAVDVYEQEPIMGGNHPFLSMPNVLCTPHLGWAEWTNFELYFREAFEQIVLFEQGKPLRLGNPDVVARRG